MPRYKVVLEFDHPGDGHEAKNGGTTLAPIYWRWNMKLVPEATNIDVTVYEKNEYVKVIETHYSQGAE